MERQPRPMGDARPRLAERQPQRQQHALSRGRDRSVPPRGRRAERRQITRSGSSTTSPRAATRRTTSWPATTAGCRHRCAASGGGGVSSMCPSMPAASSAAFPSDGFSTDGLSVRGAEGYSGVSRRLTIWGGDDHVDQRAHRMPVRRLATAPRSSSSSFTSTGAAVCLPGAAISRSPGTGTWATADHAMAPARCRARRGTCARSSSTARAIATRTAASSRAPSSASCGAARAGAADPDAPADACPPRCRPSAGSPKPTPGPPAAGGQPD